MRVHLSEVAGQLVTINVVEREDDLEGFRNFIRGNLRFLGLDTETTGLDIYSETFKVRLAQFGTPTESWVVPVEYGGRFVEDVVMALRGVQGFVLHNAAYDLQVIEQTMGLPMEEMWEKCTDTAVLAKLIDPRPAMAGGVGHSLVELTAKFIDKDVAEDVKGLMVKLAKEHKTTKDKIWAKIDLTHPEYELYAGMDPILAARLLQQLLPLVPATAKPLISYEHEIAKVCSFIERRGFLLDVEYTEQLSKDLAEKEKIGKWLAAEYGCLNVNATEQVADVLEARGVKILGRTESGKRQVNKDLLDDLVESGDPFAKLVQDTKRAGKQKSTWVDNFLKTKDKNDRVHPGINPLAARTGRMSITNPATQTLPSGDWTIRRCFLADEGQVMSSIDYQGQELRVLAALSGDPTMIQAFKENADLHLLTAQAAFGEHITKDDKERKYGKTTNFAKVFGGGAKTISKQVRIDMKTANMIVKGFEKAYPLVTKYSQMLAREAQQNGYITTETGRRLPVDPSRSYSALNYKIQSTSRDVTCRGLLRLHKAGFTPYIRLAIHDEMLCSIPEAQAEWGSKEIGRIMAQEMGPVFIGTDPEVGKRSWGSLYGAEY